MEVQEIHVNPTDASCQELGLGISSRFNVSAGTVILDIGRLGESRFWNVTQQNFLTSAVADIDYPIEIPFVPKYEISRGAEEFILKQSKAVKYKKDIITICDRMSEFLKNTGLDAKISISLFQDPEYNDWVESKIDIKVNKKDFAKTYSLYEDLLDYSLKNIKRKTLEKLIVNIEKQ